MPDQADTYKCFAVNEYGQAVVTVVLNVIEGEKYFKTTSKKCRIYHHGQLYFTSSFVQSKCIVFCGFLFGGGEGGVSSVFKTLNFFFYSSSWLQQEQSCTATGGGE